MRLKLIVFSCGMRHGGVLSASRFAVYTSLHYNDYTSVFRSPAWRFAINGCSEILVSDNIRFLWIFAGLRCVCSRVQQQTCELLLLITDAPCRTQRCMDLEKCFFSGGGHWTWSGGRGIGVWGGIYLHFSQLWDLGGGFMSSLSRVWGRASAAKRFWVFYTQF